MRFSLAFRGYRMSEVDALLDRLAAEKEQADRDDRGRRAQKQRRLRRGEWRPARD